MSGLQAHPMRVAKTYKLFIDGKFVRTESGRTFKVNVFGTDQIYAHLCLASKKDIREAVESAKKGFESWSSKTAYLRGQVLYRAAEMLEGKRDELVQTLTLTLGLNKELAHAQIDLALSGLVYYAGWTDKFEQILGASNPVAGPHHCFTSTSPVGVVGLVSGDPFEFSRVVTLWASALCSGNALVCVLPRSSGALIGPLAEVFATSDLPSGAINLLSGDPLELVATLASHMEVDAVCDIQINSQWASQIKQEAVSNLKRVFFAQEDVLGLDTLARFVEYKTSWHPIGK